MRLSVVVFLVLLGCYPYVGKLRRLPPNATAAEVEKLLGPPRIIEQPEIGTQVWTYRLAKAEGSTEYEAYELKFVGERLVSWVKWRPTPEEQDAIDADSEATRGLGERLRGASQQISNAGEEARRCQQRCAAEQSRCESQCFSDWRCRSACTNAAQNCGFACN